MKEKRILYGILTLALLGRVEKATLKLNTAPWRK